MKTGIALIALLTLVVSVNAQEYDDMYFNSKDRVKVNATKSALANTINAYDDEATQAQINPTDSYSARSVNPEYVARTRFNSGSQEEEDAQYFLSGYQPPVSVNQGLYNANASSFYNNPYYYGNSAFNNPYSGFGSGMFGSPYSGFNNPYMMGSMYNSGWYSSLGYMWGGMGSGFYGGMGFGNMWGSPSSMFWNNYYASSYGYGFGSPWYGSYYPTVVVINSNNGDANSGVAYRRRVDRGDNSSNLTSHTRPDVSYTRNGRTINSGSNNAGRTSSASTQSDYYDRSWKRNPDINPARSSWSGNNGNGSSNGFGRTSWSGNNSGNNNSGSRTSSWGNDSGSRSSWGNSGGSFSTGGGGSRSSSGGGSTSGGTSRGRH
jgi:hypothetical protein